MRLTKLKLVNYRQFEDFEQEISGNLIGLLGRNGKGKSHLLEAIHFCLAGEVPGSTKSALLRWGADDGYAELWFNHNGSSFDVMRSVSSATAVLRVTDHDGNELSPIRGITPVNAAMKDALNSDKDVYKQAVFARQKEIDAVLFTEPRERALAFHRLCGIANTQKIHDMLGGMVGQIPITYDYSAQYAEAQLASERLKGDLEAVDGQLASMGGAESLRTTLTDLEARRSALSEMLRLSGARSRLLQSIAGARLAFDEANARLTTLPAPIDEQQYSASLSEADAVLACIKRVSALKDDLARIDVELGNLVNGDKKRLDEAHGKIQEDMAESARLQGESRMYETLMAAVEGLGQTTVCPLCGSFIRNLVELKVKTAERIEALNSQRVAIQLRRKDLDSVVQKETLDLQSFAINRARLLSSKEHKAVELAGLDKPYPPRADVERDILILADTLSAARDSRTVRDRYTAERERQRGAIETSEKQLSEMKAPEVGDVEISTMASGVELQMRDIRGKIEAYHELSGRKSALEKSVTEAETASARLVELSRSLDAHRAALDTLLRVRDWFHYSNGPHAVATSFLNVLTADVNMFLEKFTAPFMVVPDEESLGFKVHFTDGRQMPKGELPPADELSGGEKIMLAVSFRLANYKLFAAKLGLLTLDEPTVYLDKPNIVNFCAVVDVLKTIANNLNLQVIIATHEETVMTYFDSLVNLSQ